MVTNTEKGQLPVKITAFIEKDPNAPAAAKPATPSINPLATDNGAAAAAPRKYSTQPGHEGHNHD